MKWSNWSHLYLVISANSFSSQTTWLYLINRLALCLVMEGSKWDCIPLVSFASIPVAVVSDVACTDLQYTDSETIVFISLILYLISFLALMYVMTLLEGQEKNPRISLLLALCWFRF